MRHVSSYNLVPETVTRSRRIFKKIFATIPITDTDDACTLSRLLSFAWLYKVKVC